jgi:hypothetical protein
VGPAASLEGEIMKAVACLSVLLLHVPSERARFISVPAVAHGDQGQARPTDRQALVTLANVAVSDSPSVKPGTSIRAVDFDLVNTTNKIVTAWEVAFVATRQDGQTEVTTFGADGYKEYANLIPAPPSGSGVIAPHGTIHASTTLSTPVTVSIVRLQSSVTFVVFGDGTWWGDEAAARKLFEQREARCDALYEMVTALRKARLSAKGRDSLVAALSNLDALPPGLPAGVAIVMRRNIKRVLDDPTMKGDPDALLVHWLLQTEAEWQAADNQRRQGPRVGEK